MGQISTSTGLVSGFDYGSLIDQLIQVESRSKNLVESRTAVLQSQNVAYQDINAKLLALRTSLSTSLTRSTTFRASSATSSNTDVLEASAKSGAIPGSYQFTVKQMVTSQQMITGGFRDTNETALAAGSMTFEDAAAALDTDIELAKLNGGEGVQRGEISITDRSGNTARVNLSTALTLDEVIEAINNASGVSVTASADGDGLVLTDNSGGSGTLSVSNVGGRTTASDLGLAGSIAGNTLTGTAINVIGTETLLSDLRDGLGIEFNSEAQDDITINHGGGSFNVNLNEAETVGEVIDLINQAASDAGAAVTATVNDTNTGIKLDGATSAVDINGSLAAAHLGIDTLDGSGNGARILTELGSISLDRLNGGNGITTLGTIDVTNRNGTTTSIDLSSAQSVSDLVDLINAAGAGVTAAINEERNGLTITDTTGGNASNLIIADNTGTTAADLNIAQDVAASKIESENLQRQYISNSTLLSKLNGGAGIERGRFIITDSAGNSATVDLTQGNEITVGDVLSEINSRGIGVTARINDNGDGIYLEDTATGAGAGAVAMSVVENGSTTAKDLGILGTADIAGGDIDGSFETTIDIPSSDLISSSFLLADLNGGDGVETVAGSDDFEITTRDGSTFNINMDGLTTVGDLITAIDTATGGAVTTEVNASGTALKLTDTTTGSASFSITALNGSKAAANLGIDTAQGNTSDVINGDTIHDLFTLEDLVEEINSSGSPFKAAIINDGSSRNPYRLTLQTETSGKAGAFLFDDGGIGIGATTLVDAQDAAIFLGSSDPATAIAITSSSNTISDAIPNTTLTVKGTSSSPVTVSITRDTSTIQAEVQKFVDNFNTVLSTLEKYDFYDSDTEERGLLFGESVTQTVENSLLRLVNTRNNDLDTQYKTLQQIGISYSDGKLQFDTEDFQSALSSDPDAVRQLFAFVETDTNDEGETEITKQGIGVAFRELINNLTDSVSGVVQRRIDGLDNQIELNKDRISSMDEALVRKRERLTSQFIAMEQAIAEMQNQQSSLANLASIASNARAI